MAQTLTVLEEAKQNLVKMEPEFKASLPSHISVDKFTNVAKIALQNNQDLLSCNRQSLWNSIIKCAQDGLLPNGREAALVKMKDSVAYLPMVQGILKKVRNSGELATVDAKIVYEKDFYECYTDEKGVHFKHVEAFQVDKGLPILTYAYAITKDGATYHEQILEEDMKKIEAIAKTGMIWTGPFRNEMKRKSAIHRLSKRLPMSTDLEQVIRRDEELYDMPVKDEQQKTTTSSKLSEAVNTVKKEPIETTATVSQEVGPSTQAGTGGAEPPKNESPEPGIFKEILIEKISYQYAKPDAKTPWVLAGVKIGDDYYNTFDKNIHVILEEAKTKRILVNVHFKEETKNGKSYKVITEVTYPTAEEIWNSESQTQQGPI